MAKSLRIKIFGGRYDRYRVRAAKYGRPVQISPPGGPGSRWEEAPAEIVSAIGLWEKSEYRTIMGLGAFLARMFANP